MAKKEQVLIVGGGFGGVKTALELCDDPRFEVTLMTESNELRYYPTLYISATGGKRSNSSIPLDVIFENKEINIIKASLTELPIVASNIEGIKDAVTNGKNGILVNQGDEAAFIREILSFVDDSELAKTFGKKSREYTKQNYSWSVIAKSYAQCYKNLH